MCLAVPGKIIEINAEKLAIIDFGGISKEINCQLIQEEIQKGDYVLVHIGYAISKVDEKEALETLALWKEIGGELPV